MNHLGMTLQRTPGLPVYIDNLTIRITGEVNSNVDYNPGHLLVDLCLESAILVSHLSWLNIIVGYLLFRFFLLDVRLQFSRDGCHLVEETEFSIVEFFGLSGQRSDHSVGHLVELGFHRILLENEVIVTVKEAKERSTTYNFCHVIFETICFHVPNDLVAKQLRYLGGLKDEIGDIACGEERLCLDIRNVDMRNAPRSSYRRA